MSGTLKAYNLEATFATKKSSSIDCDKIELSKGDDSDKTVNSTVNKKSSIDVTKALLLLGFPSWSSLEEGMHSYKTVQS